MCSKVPKIKTKILFENYYVHDVSATLLQRHWVAWAGRKNLHSRKVRRTPVLATGREGTILSSIGRVWGGIVMTGGIN